VLLREALEEDPGFESALERLAGLMLKQGRWEDAREYANRCVNVNPGNIACHSILIESASQDGTPEQVTRYLLDCQAADHENGSCLKSMVTRYLYSGDYPMAAEALELLVERDPASPQSHLLRAQYFDKTGDTAAALEQYREACALGLEIGCTHVPGTSHD
jgi:Tfp pilus assembly protein PilF